MFIFTILIASLLVVFASVYMMYHLWRYAKCHMELDQEAADKKEVKSNV